MGTPGPQKTKRYSQEFKLHAVAMSQQPGVLVQDVAESLCIHPFMLSRWRKEARDGLLTGAAVVPVPEAVAPQPSFQVNVYATQGHVFGASELSAKSSST